MKILDSLLRYSLHLCFFLSLLYAVLTRSGFEKEDYTDILNMKIPDKKTRKLKDTVNTVLETAKTKVEPDPEKTDRLPASTPVIFNQTSDSTQKSKISTDS